MEGDEMGDENSDTFIPSGFVCWSVAWSVYKAFLSTMMTDAAVRYIFARPYDVACWKTVIFN